MNRLDEHVIDGEWHFDWEDGICAYDDDDRTVLIIDRKVHRHPFGTEYTEILELEEGIV